MDEEAGKRRSEAQKKRWAEGRGVDSSRLSLAQKKRWAEGRGRPPATEEARKRMRESHLGIPLSKEHRKALAKAQTGRKQSETTKKKLSQSRVGENNPSWKGGVIERNIAIYDTYAPQLFPVEETRRDPSDRNKLQVKCTYCGKWISPKQTEVRSRVKALSNRDYGEARLYCDIHCKRACSIYGKQLYEVGHEPATSREVQPELRKMVFMRDGYACQKCGSTKQIHCHHFEGIRYEPIESADADACITLCKVCHGKAHMDTGCKPHELRCNNAKERTDS